MTTGVIQIDLDKIQTIEEVKAILKILVIAHTGSSNCHLQIRTDLVNHMPILNNLVKEN